MTTPTDADRARALKFYNAYIHDHHFCVDYGKYPPRVIDRLAKLIVKASQEGQEARQKFDAELAKCYRADDAGKEISSDADYGLLISWHILNQVMP